MLLVCIGSTVGLNYTQCDEACPLWGYVDSDFAYDINDRKSTSWYLFQVFGSTVSWSTRKQSTVALSSKEAKYLALASLTQEAMWPRGLLMEKHVLGYNESIVLYEDNQSCILIAQEPWTRQRLKEFRYQIQIHPWRHLNKYNRVRICFNKGSTCKCSH